MFRLQVKSKNKKSGSSRASYRYISRYDKTAPNSLDLVYEKSNIPKCYDNAENFWDDVDNKERKNGNIHREILISIPREMIGEDIKEVMSKFIKRTLGESTPYTYAIHNHIAKDGKDNIHTHLIFYNKKVPIEYFKDEKLDFGKTFNKSNKEYIPKHLKYSKKEFVYRARQNWEKCINDYMGYKLLSEKNIKREIMDMYGFNYKDIKGVLFDKKSLSKQIDDVDVIDDKNNSYIKLRKYLFDRAFDSLKSRYGNNIDLKHKSNVGNNFIKDLSKIVSDLSLGKDGINYISNLLKKNDILNFEDIKNDIKNYYLPNSGGLISEFKTLRDEFDNLIKDENFNFEDKYKKYISNDLSNEILNNFIIKYSEEKVKVLGLQDRVVVRDFSQVNLEFKEMINVFENNLKIGIENGSIEKNNIKKTNDIINEYFENLANGIYKDLGKKDSSVKFYLNSDYLRFNFELEESKKILKQSINLENRILDNINENNIVNGLYNYYDLMKKVFKEELLELYITLNLTKYYDDVDKSELSFDLIDDLLNSKDEFVVDLLSDVDDEIKKELEDIFKNFIEIKNEKLSIDDLKMLGVIRDDVFEKDIFEKLRKEKIDNLQPLFKNDRDVARNFLKNVGIFAKNLYDRMKEKIKNSYGLTDSLIKSVRDFVNVVENQSVYNRVDISDRKNNLGLNNIKLNLDIKEINSGYNFISNLEIKDSKLKNNMVLNSVYKFKNYLLKDLEYFINSIDRKNLLTMREYVDKFVKSDKKYSYKDRLKNAINRYSYIRSDNNLLLRKYDKDINVESVRNIIFGTKEKEKLKKLLELKENINLDKNKYKLVEFNRKELTDLNGDYENFERDLKMFEELYYNIENDLNVTMKKEKKLLNDNMDEKVELGEVELKLILSNNKDGLLKNYNNELEKIKRVSRLELNNIGDKLRQESVFLEAISNMENIKKKVMSSNRYNFVNGFKNHKGYVEKSKKIEKNTGRIRAKVYMLIYLKEKFKRYYEDRRDLGIEDKNKLTSDKKLFMELMENKNGNNLDYQKQLNDILLNKKKRLLEKERQNMQDFMEKKKEELESRLNEKLEDLNETIKFKFNNDRVDGDEYVSDKITKYYESKGIKPNISGEMSLSGFYNVIRGKIDKGDIDKVDSILKESKKYKGKLSEIKYDVMKEFNDKYCLCKDLEDDVEKLDLIKRVVEKMIVLESRKTFNNKVMSMLVNREEIIKDRNVVNSEVIEKWDRRIKEKIRDDLVRR